MAEKPIATQTSPYAVEVRKDETYYWCACGRSKNQPFCDGSHQGTGLTPLSFTASETKTVYLCGCRQSGKQPFCDGTHNSL